MYCKQKNAVDGGRKQEFLKYHKYPFGTIGL
jgi:hypothetical protein